MIGGVCTQRSRQHRISNEGVNHPYIIMVSNLNPLINQDDLDETLFNPLDFYSVPPLILCMVPRLIKLYQSILDGQVVG